MAAPMQLTLHYENTPEVNLSSDDIGKVVNLQDVKNKIRETLRLPPGEFDLFDIHGHIENDVDLLRAFHKFNRGEESVWIEVKNSWEQNHYLRIGHVEDRTENIDGRLKTVEATMASSEPDGYVGVLNKLQDLQNQINALDARVVLTERFIPETYEPMIEDLCHSRDQMGRDIRIVQEKFGTFDIEELREVIMEHKENREQIAKSVIRTNQIDAELQQNKARDIEDAAANKQMVDDLHRYVQGKLEAVIEGDAALAKQIEDMDMHVRLMADDIRLLKEDHALNVMKCNEFIEENQSVRTIMGQIREDTEHIKVDAGMTKERIHVMEGKASENWEGFLPGVLYFRRWHRTAKGNDVKLSGNLMSATARGFTASFGVVMQSDEGLAIGDGPCRRFGTPGNWSSYYEVEVELIQPAPPNCGGLYVGFAIQNGDEVMAHPKHEFDGWLVGGAGKALTCRAGLYGEAQHLDPSKLPATYVPSRGNEAAGLADDKTAEIASAARLQALELLRAALPPMNKGQVREADAGWNSQGLKLNDRVGVLFKCSRGGGATMKVTVNQEIVISHIFVDAPSAEALGFLTPIIRLAGSGKCARILPGLQPPARLLAD